MTSASLEYQQLTMPYPNIFEGWASALHTVDGTLSILLTEWLHVMVDGKLFKVTHAITQRHKHNIPLPTLYMTSGGVHILLVCSSRDTSLPVSQHQNHYHCDPCHRDDEQHSHYILLHQSQLHSQSCHELCHDKVSVSERNTFSTRLYEEHCEVVFIDISIHIYTASITLSNLVKLKSEDADSLTAILIIT